ncbi:MFS transporter [Trebonia kvetii]|uniref:MFS transporter n=1 Tax=Trebonia kvetii TaxID=2480626 RepID=A0A6P2C0J2_9ACTN|nr:MFS transporter [Trebonia kvetii]
MVVGVKSPEPKFLNYRSKFPGERLGVLAIRDFRLFYVGYSASLLGTAMSTVAIAFAVLGNGGSPTGLGVVLAANIVPMIAFMLGGGALADRLGRRPVMLAADVARCLAQGGLAAALSLGHPRLWLFAAAALVVGTGNAFFQPALSGLPVDLAPRERLGDVNALLAVARPAAQIAGPALAGILIAATSPAAAVAADAASYAASAVALAMLRFPRTERPAARSLPRELADGWAEFAARDWIWAPTVAFALFNLLTWGPYLVLGPVLARDYLGGARAWGTSWPVTALARSSAACSRSAAVPGGRWWSPTSPRSASRCRRSPSPCTCRRSRWPPRPCSPAWAPRSAARSKRQWSSTWCRPGCCPASGRSTWSARSPSGPSPSSPRDPRRRPSAPARCSDSARPGPSLAHSPSSRCPPSAACPGQDRARRRALASRAPATGCRRSAHGRRPGGRRGRRSR